MKPLVFNSTHLIYLSKPGLSGIIENLQGEKLTSLLVKAEVVDKGKLKGFRTQLLWRNCLRMAFSSFVNPKIRRFFRGCLRRVGFMLRMLKF